MATTYKEIERENKRWIQAQLASRLNNMRKLNPNLGDDSILVLSGPQPEEAIEYYKKYDLYDKCILVEQDIDTFIKAKRRLKPNNKEFLLHNNIFNIAYVHRNQIRGIDFDFCTGLNDYLIKNIVGTIISLDKPCVWFRITSCHRGISKEKLRKRFNVIIEAIEQFSDYTMIDESLINYRDTATMNCWQVVLRNNKRMEDGTMRTLKEMSEGEREIARIVVERKYGSRGSRQRPEYDDKDIQEALRIAPMSVAALKAHLTMRKKR